MSLAEAPTETFKKFAATSGWQNAQHDQLSGDFLSISNETNLVWDSGFYESINGQLADSVTKRPISETANSGTYLDTPETEVNEQLNSWFAENDSGLAVWISPKYESYYPEEKISVYRIAYKFSGEKILLRSHLLFKADLTQTEDLRRFIFTEDDQEESLFAIIKWVEKVAGRDISASIDTTDLKFREGQAKHYAAQYRNGVPLEQIVRQMEESGFIGQNPISCGTNSSTSLGALKQEIAGASSAGEDQYGSLEFECPHCHKTNRRQPGLLLTHCKFCQQDVSC